MSSLSGRTHITARTTPSSTTEHHPAPRNEHHQRAPPTAALGTCRGLRRAARRRPAPTFEALPRFTADLQHLTPAQRRRFRHIVLDAFVPDLRTGRQFRPGLRIKGVRCAPGMAAADSSTDCLKSGAASRPAAKLSRTGARLAGRRWAGHGY
ncbi:hypothetical protein GCM10010274_58170 [Streptomyces lavendofoliae]|uniref:Uncharacterized protein n=1 Tax=Streptomyces lavendofoliae TaxID=67314 RepID=A0A918I3Q3_9ACTN|nr:hypothetical protein GCM10010274_58170 [Streptomyces lavendofoliae]